MKNFQKGGGAIGEVLKFVTHDRSLRKKNATNVCVFCKNNSILRPFQDKFGRERPVLGSAKRAQNKHKKNWMAQAKLSDILSNDVMRKIKKRN